MNNITMQKKLEALIRYIEGLSISYHDHSDNCGIRNNMVMSRCDCYYEIFIDLKNAFKEIDYE